MLTNAHLFGQNDGDKHCNNSESELVGTTADVDGATVGKITKANKYEDWVLIDESLGENYQGHIDAYSTSHDVNGFVSEPTIDIWCSDKTECVSNMGRITGDTTGKIKATDINSTDICVDFNGHGVSTYCNFGLGDSGSPTYYVEPSTGKAYILGVTGFADGSLKTISCDAEVFGRGISMPAYHLAKSHNIRFEDNFAK